MAKTVLSMVKARLKSKHKPRKINNMAKRKGGKRSSGRRGFGGGFGGIGGIFKNRTVQAGALALGLGTVGAIIASKTAPQYTQLASIGVPLLGGAGFQGVIVAEALKAFAGAPSLLSGFTGGGMGNAQAGMTA